eukprot:gnl/TRDRNA2_/TRDRNA2_184120_c0_seq1.p1 gnl/TRDRNA2_/TRDRNA2_184120_c0~~gnl/TRDRNA2_/TRDRNA2_184120_c0_seq1.p1  ORF type:complete len:103 (+),score=30.91 gnl/TRDRNA2_/TRDRNA2_184120_c0_seq1:37-309(+)
MFPNLRLPVVDTMWQLSIGAQEGEAWLAAEEARYAAKLEAIRNRVPLAPPVGFDSKTQSDDPPPKEEEEEDEDMDDDEEFTDDDGPADRF